MHENGEKGRAEPGQKMKSIVKRYSKKYQRTLESFSKFMDLHVDMDPDQKRKIMGQIRKRIEDTSSLFSEEQLKLYLSMIAATQAGRDIKLMDDSELRHYEIMRFVRSSRNESTKLTKKIRPSSPLIQEKGTVPQQDIDRPPQFDHSQKAERTELASQGQTSAEPESHFKIGMGPSSAKVEERHTPLQEVEGVPLHLKITRFEKTGQDFMNPVIKYEICFRNNTTWRRYSQFERLMALLRYKYEGIVLPELPPKEGIKKGWNYLWGNSLDENFLTERQSKLQQLLNRLLKCSFVCKEDMLLKFISDPSFQVPQIHGDASDPTSSSYLQKLSGLTEIVFNYNELKDYGMAYYNYLSEHNKSLDETKITEKYRQISGLINTVLTINAHRIRMNRNFNRRRDFMEEYGIKCRLIAKTDTDTALQRAENDCLELQNEYKKYLQLRSHESWLNYVTKQKNSNGSAESNNKVAEDCKKTRERLNKIQNNLMKSMSNFQEDILQVVGRLKQDLFEWRIKVHP